MEPIALAIVVTAVAVVLIVTLSTVQIVPQAHAAVIERLGRYTHTLDAGFHVITPIVDRRRCLVDLREQVVVFPHQPVITEDNVTISVDTVFYYSISDPFRATYEVAAMLDAIEQLVITTLRNQVGTLTLEEVLTSRERVNADLRHAMDEATGRWGLRVNRVELKSIDPPGSIKQAMEKQMRAERDRRAAILTAEGEKQSAILVAEGEARARILQAEAEQRAAALEADGDRQAKVLRAAGDSEAIRAVFRAVHESDPTPGVLAYMYMQVLPEVADGRATTLILPADAVPAAGATATLGSVLAAQAVRPGANGVHEAVGA
jgi:regulator of protease activity HflC (stomatin/prohibitin superfamily)